MEAAEITLRIWVVVLSVLTGFALGLAIRNYNELRLQRHGLSKLIDLVTKLEVEFAAKKVADQITNMIFGEDSPEDLEQAIKDVADKEGFDVSVVKAKKKTTKKSTKKEAK